MATKAFLEKAYLAYFGRPVDSTGLTDYAPSTDAQVADAFAASAESKALYGSTFNYAQINAIYLALFNREAEKAGLEYWYAKVADKTFTPAGAAIAILNGALNADKIAVENKLAASAAFTAALDTAPEMIGYSGDAAAASARSFLSTITATAATAAAVDAAIVSVVAARTAVPAQTFTLTSGLDAFTGSNGNDTFQGDSSNIGALDKIAGGLGNDTLLLTSTAAAVTLSSFNISAIETLSFSAATAGHTATLSGLTGITNVNNLGSSVALTVGVGANSLTSAATAIAISSTASNTTVVFAETAVTGSADAVTVTLSGVTGAAQVNVDTGTATATVAGAVETINVVSTGATNSVTLETNDTQGLGTINISGDQQVTIALGTNAATDAIIINAGTATGKVLVSNIGAGNTFAAVATGHTITGGSNDDTFTFTAGYIGAEATVASATRDIVNGGNGTDRLSIVAADAVTASAAAQVNLTSIEALTISDAINGTQAINVTRFADVKALTLTAAVAANYTGTVSLATGTAVTLGASTVANATVTFAVAGTSVTDTMTLNTAGFSFAGTGTETFTGIEALTINTGAAVVGTSAFADATTFTQSAGSTSSTVTASGINGLTFTGVVTGVSLLDASALTGVLTVTAAPAGAITIRGGSGADTINGSTSADLIVGNAGNDTLLGAAGNDSIDGGDGIDSITGDAGADTMTGGAGVDTFIFDATAGNASNGANGAAVAEVITDFVVGTDKLQFTNVTEAASAVQTAVQAAVTALASTATDAQIATAMAAASITTATPLSFAVFGGSTYVYYETTVGTATHVAADNIFIKLAGVASGFTITGDVIA